MCSGKMLVIFFFAIAALSHSNEALRILGVFPLPSRSHFIMGEELFKILAKKGHEIDVVSHFPQKKTLANYRDISLEGLAVISINNKTINDAHNTQSETIKSFMEKFGTSTCKFLGSSPLQDLLKKPKDSYDVVIVEIFGAHCYLALGSYFNAPVVGVVTTKLPDWLFTPFGNSFNSAYMGSFFTSFIQDMNFVERLQNTYQAVVTTHVFNYYLEAQREHVDKYFGRKISSVQDLYNDVAILLVNSYPNLNEIIPTTPDVIEIGGLHVDGTGQHLSPELEKWLDESKEGCVYITFGSMVKIETLPADKLEAFYEMFRRIEPVRVLMKIADPKLLPPDLPKNVKTSSWLPQVAVLKHKNVRAFVTHGGSMGTQESIAHGVPLVGFAFFGDQHRNINSYEKMKVAVALDIKTFDADKLTNAVNIVLKDPEYRKNIKQVSELFMDRPMSAKDTAIYWIEYAARHGTRLKSPATKLTWYQYHLLDVYGFILGSVLLVLFIFKKIFGFISRCYFHRKRTVNESSNISVRYKKTE